MKSHSFRTSAERFSWIYRAVAGAREQVYALIRMALLFSALSAVGALVIIRVLNVGPYAEFHLTRNLYLALLVWGAASLIILVLAVKASLALSERIAGPIRRMERVLDRAIEGKKVRISLRDQDALAALALRINHLIKTLPAGKHDRS